MTEILYQIIFRLISLVSPPEKGISGQVRQVSHSFCDMKTLGVNSPLFSQTKLRACQLVEWQTQPHT